MIVIMCVFIIAIIVILNCRDMGYFTEEQKHIERFFFGEELDESDKEYWKKYEDSLKGW